MRLPRPQFLNAHGEMTVNTPTALDIPTVPAEAETTKKKVSTYGVRHMQCFLLFCGLSVAYSHRVNLSVAIVAMTDKDHANPDFNEYPWNEKEKSLLLSSFFWGYIITQIPSGQLAKMFGGKVMLFYGILICSVLAILTPICADIGSWQLVCALRVIQGLCQGVIFPSSHTILSKWAPVEERGSFGTYCYSGSQFGTVVMLATSGILASSIMGWPSIFYISGGVGVIWAFAWYKWGASSPNEHKSISVEEKKLIETSLAHNSHDATKKPLKTPWAKFFTSPAFIVLIIVHSSHNWGFWTLLTEIPTYMKNILGMDIKQNALLSALPYFAMFVMCFVFSAISTILNKRQCISLSVSRKLFNTIGHWVPMVTLICLGYVGAGSTTLAIALLTVTVGINASTYLGFQVNHIDLSPNFAGVLMGITNCVANIMSIIAPLIVGFIVTDEKNADQWRTIFFIAAGFYFVGNFLFLIFGRTVVQPWNNLEVIPNMKNRKHPPTHVESQH